VPGTAWLDDYVMIRNARPDELAEIGEIRVAAYRADGYLAAESHYEPTLRALGADGTGEVLVAERPDGKLVGTVMLQRWPQAGEVVAGPDEAEVRALAVLPAARGDGLGRALLAAVLDRAVHAGVRHLVLSTQTAMKTAHHLYESSGFQRIPDRDWSPVPGVKLLVYGLVLA
jgi:ribosomal protein S18 acetylase RimI-like enzyme